MIDEEGKRIVENKPEDDWDFVRAEVRFLMKGFRKEKDDAKANLIACQLKSLLKAAQYDDSIKETLEELEEYSSESSSDDLLWELVYCRRKLADLYEEGSMHAVECRLKGAKHFDKIVELRPTLFNFCCRVQEYVTSVIYYMSVSGADRDSFEIRKIIDKSERLFEEIEENTNKIYIETADYLYIRKYIFLKPYKSKEDEQFAALGKAIYHLCESYKVNKDESTLRSLITYYREYVNFEQFYCDEKKQGLETLIAWVEESGLSGVSSSLSKLRAALNRSTD